MKIAGVLCVEENGKTSIHLILKYCVDIILKVKSYILKQLLLLRVTESEV